MDKNYTRAGRDTGSCRFNTYTAARTQKQRGIPTRLEAVTRVFYCRRNRMDVPSELAPRKKTVRSNALLLTFLAREPRMYGLSSSALRRTQA